MSVRTVAAADKKPHARKFCTLNHGNLEHLFSDNSALIGSCGAKGPDLCDVCSSRRQKCTYNRETQHVDLVTAGLPCQPFTKLRQTNGNTADTGSASTHSKYDVVFEDFFKYLSLRRPRGFIVEEVSDFTGRSDEACFLDEFVARAERAGYSAKALMLHADIWVALPRSRPGGGAHESSSYSVPLPLPCSRL